jgi:hypothetical protein
MIRILKLIAVAAMALVAVGATATSGAQAAEFHCSVEPCRFTVQPDETAGTKTAHHVLVLTNEIGHSVSVTCTRITGHGTSPVKTTTTVTLTGIAYDGCTFVGQLTNIQMNGCVYEVNSHGLVSVNCPEGKKIEWEVPGCKVTIGSQTVFGLSFHNIGTPGTVSTAVTVSASIKGIAAEMIGTKAGCGGVDPTHKVTGEFTTGNTIVRTEADQLNPIQTEGWWA